jgi:hypothetical protein
VFEFLQSRLRGAHLRDRVVRGGARPVDVGGGDKLLPAQRLQARVVRARIARLRLRRGELRARPRNRFRARARFEFGQGP